MMKKVFFALAIAGMFGFAACNNNKAAEETVDTAAAVMEQVEDAAMDMTEEAAEAVEGAVEEVATEEAAQ